MKKKKKKKKKFKLFNKIVNFEDEKIEISLPDQFILEGYYISEDCNFKYPNIKSYNNSICNRISIYKNDIN